MSTINLHVDFFLKDNRSTLSRDTIKWKLSEFLCLEDTSYHGDWSDKLPPSWSLRQIEGFCKELETFMQNPLRGASVVCCCCVFKGNSRRLLLLYVKGTREKIISDRKIHQNIRKALSDKLDDHRFYESYPFFISPRKKNKAKELNADIRFLKDELKKKFCSGS